MAFRLALDTSGPKLFVALADDETGRVLEAEGSGPESHGEDLPAVVARLLETADAKAEAVEAVVVGAGPGSFTGLRIGFGFAKGFAQATGAELHVVSSFEAFAHEFRAEGADLTVLADARRDEYFVGFFVSRPSGVERLGELEIVPRERLHLVEAERRGASLQERAASVVVDFFSGYLSDDEKVRRPAHVGRSLVELSRGRSEALRTPSELGAADPEYLRPVAALSIAEREAKRRQSLELKVSPEAKADFC